ncbi:type II secretion system minor pseudopilin GspJ [Pleionea litopenaei]|uniref:Type II secretion system protein J n=1 Tax=Pleionea litopenaei TaxID=3070815 RepID=A0AA51RQJ2_9GAMM|nr:type II secretion system minor pseudopilin GspJ [Pleionea sp. HL-JVS1]WMS85797.1 type II secretion system minor pseudopilin GspJ [Pleionea sp. HL-JVS1]
MKQTKGFSLLEVLIAVAVTAFIAASAFSILSQAIKTKENQEANDERLAELQRAMTRISLDIQLLADRAVRNEFGDLLPPLMGDKSAEESFLSLTRQGKRNPANLPRTEMERVTYRLKEGDLIREQWLMLDIASTDQIVERSLITKVAKFEVEFYTEEQWIDSWPQSDLANYNRNDLATLKPKAVKVIIELEDFGLVTQVYPLGGGQ